MMAWNFFVGLHNSLAIKAFNTRKNAVHCYVVLIYVEYVPTVMIRFHSKSWHVDHLSCDCLITELSVIIHLFSSLRKNIIVR